MIFFTLYYKDTGGGKNDHFLTYFGDYLILFNSIPQKVAKKGGGSTFLLLKGISIYQELENWRICKLHILNSIRI